ncbi:hypothetical protein BDZ89DRAFT_471228 [Hymenopellis radicata]|nr:hypothetical protein BDZ89DRAFT_471228 [Hymenopellis radicata]
MSETIDAPQDSLNGSQGSASGERKLNVRARVWRACEVCRKRKVKCNGQEPCSYCLSSGKICSFKDISDNAALARQQANTVDSRLSKVEETLRGLLPMTQAFEAWSQKNPHASQLPFSMPNAEAGPSTKPQYFPPRNADQTEAYRPSTAVQRLSRFPTNGASGSPTSISDPVEDETLDGPEQWSDRFSHLTKDSYGNLRYTGGASTYMLVDALTTLHDSTTDASPESQSSRRNVDITLPFFNPGHYFKTQEALPRPEDIPYPTPEQGDELIEIFFKCVHYSFPLLHQHLFLERYMKVMASKHSGKPSRDTAFLALMFSVFACGSCVLGRKHHSASSKSSTPTSDFGGMDYYQRAQLLFWMCTGESQIEQVQCLALLAVCNASWNTLAQGWLNAGQAIRRAQDLGLHRSSRRSNLSALDKEIRRRVWWCVYSLDRLLSMALGRPSGAHDDDCNVELPVELDDAQLLASSEGSVPRPGSSNMTGFIALLKIYVIAGKVMRFVHSPRIDEPFSEETQDVVASLDGELEAWINGLPPAVRFAANDRQNPQMLSLCLITFFIYYSSIINLHRPFIPDDSSPSNDLTSLGQCMSAARSCIRIGEITQEMLPSSHYMAFAVQFITLSGVVLLRCIHYVNDEELVSAIIHDAEKCVSILEGLEDVWPASKRCREIVSDLLVVVKMKLNGGPIAIENLQASQETVFTNNEERKTETRRHGV